jgi:transposase-like protein
MNSPTTLMEAVKYFSDPDVAHKFVVDLRWPDGVECPTCGSKHVRYIATRRLFECNNKHAQKQFSVKVGTIFEDSPLPIGKWLMAIWMEANSKNSISSYEVHRAIGVTQKTAWFMQQRIRLAMQSGTFTNLSGEVEVDETYIGGKARNMHAGKRKAKGRGLVGKTIVMGLLERHSKDKPSKVRTLVVKDVTRKNLRPQVREHVKLGSNVYTNELVSYAGLAPHYAHKVINHAETYAKGEVHTNGLENYWSLFKRCIKGTHISVEPFHLFRYPRCRGLPVQQSQEHRWHAIRQSGGLDRREAFDIQGLDR